MGRVAPAHRYVDARPAAHLGEGLVSLVRWLLGRDHVRGVAWGAPRRAGQLLEEERALLLLVARKPPLHAIRRGSRLQRSYDGVHTDVVEIGRARVHTLSPRMRVLSGARPSALSTAVRREDGSVVGLVSGHGTLGRPLHAGERHPLPGALPLRAVGFGFSHGGFVERGVFAPDQDWSLARFDADAVGDHPAVGRAGLQLAGRQPSPGARLRFWSPMDGALRQGIAGAALLSDLAVHVPGSPTHRYRGLVLVQPMAGGKLSRPGDSGSLVFEGTRACGLLVAGSTPPGKASFVLPLAGLADHHPEVFATFFRTS